MILLLGETMNAHYEKRAGRWEEPKPGPPSISRHSLIDTKLSSANEGRKVASRITFGLSGLMLVLLLAFPEHAAEAYGLVLTKLSLAALAISFSCGACCELGGKPLPESSVDQMLIRAIKMRVQALRPAGETHFHPNLESGAVQCLFGGKFLAPQISSFAIGFGLLLVAFLFR